MKELTEQTGYGRGVDPLKAFMDDIRSEGGKDAKAMHYDEVTQKDAEFYKAQTVYRTFDPTATSFGEGYVQKHLSKTVVTSEESKEGREAPRKGKRSAPNAPTESDENQDNLLKIQNDKDAWTTLAELEKDFQAEKTLQNQTLGTIHSRTNADFETPRPPDEEAEIPDMFMPKTTNWECDEYQEDMEQHKYGDQIMTKELGSKKVFTDDPGWTTFVEQEDRTVKYDVEDQEYHANQEVMKQYFVMKNVRLFANPLIMENWIENISCENNSNDVVSKYFMNEHERTETMMVNPNLLYNSKNFAIVIDTNIFIKSQRSLLELIFDCEGLDINNNDEDDDEVIETTPINFHIPQIAIEDITEFKNEANDMKKSSNQYKIAASLNEDGNPNENENAIDNNKEKAETLKNAEQAFEVIFKQLKKKENVVIQDVNLKKALNIKYNNDYTKDMGAVDNELVIYAKYLQDEIYNQQRVVFVLSHDKIIRSKCIDNHILTGDLKKLRDYLKMGRTAKIGVSAVSLIESRQKHLITSPSVDQDPKIAEFEALYNGYEQKIETFGEISQNNNSKGYHKIPQKKAKTDHNLNKNRIYAKYLLNVEELKALDFTSPNNFFYQAVHLGLQKLLINKASNVFGRFWDTRLTAKVDTKPLVDTFNDLVKNWEKLFTKRFEQNQNKPTQEQREMQFNNKRGYTNALEILKNNFRNPIYEAVYSVSSSELEATSTLITASYANNKYAANKKVLEMDWEQLLDSFQAFLIDITEKEYWWQTKDVCHFLSEQRLKFMDNADQFLGISLQPTLNGGSTKNEKLDSILANNQKFEPAFNVIDLFILIRDKIKFVMETAIPSKIEELVTGSFPSRVFIEVIKIDIDKIQKLGVLLSEVLKCLINYKRDYRNEKGQEVFWKDEPKPDRRYISSLLILIRAMESFEIKALSSTGQSQSLGGGGGIATSYSVGRGYLDGNTNNLVFLSEKIAEKMKNDKNNMEFDILGGLTYSCCDYEFMKKITMIHDQVEKLRYEFTEKIETYENEYFDENLAAGMYMPIR